MPQFLYICIIVVIVCLCDLHVGIRLIFSVTAMFLGLIYANIKNKIGSKYLFQASVAKIECGMNIFETLKSRSEFLYYHSNY